ncbi:MAG: putative peptidoglycan-binding domain-containing protein [Bacteroidota bacterium]
MMQQALGLSRDGIVGPITLNAINRADPATLFNAYKETRRRGYEDLLRRRPWMENPWRRVWMNRIDSFFYRGSSPGGNRTLPTVNVNAQRSSAGQDGTITAVAIAVAAYFLLS